MADKSLFNRLQRLFSTDVVIRNQGGNSLKVIDADRIQTSGEYETNALMNRFKGIYQNPNSTSLYGAQFNLNYQYLRTQLYNDYDAMDQDAIVASALDIIADESTLKNEYGEVLTIKSPDDDVQKILYNLFYDILNIEFNLWSWTRQMCKYGDFFLKLEISEQFGVYNVIPYSAYHIERKENFDPEHPTKVVFNYNPEGFVTGTSTSYMPNKSSQNVLMFDNYEVAHFRLLSDMNYLPYGRSYIEPGRKLFKQYMLMEDAMLIHRIVRAPEKRIFYMNVGGIPPNEVENFMQKTISTMKRSPHMNPETGEYDLKYNINNMLEDYYIPVRGNDAATRIDTAPGLQYDGIQDVEYLRDKLFAALKVPKAFMGYDENTDGKATLAAEDIRFARTIERIQRIMVSELYKIALVHLYAQGYKDEQLVNFEISLTTPSIIYDQERIALMKEKVELASQIMEAGLLPTDWIYDNIFHFSEDEYEEYRSQILEDKKRKFRQEQIEGEGNDPLETGKSYGTPHDLASLYGRGRYDDASVPDGYDEKADLGRPQEKATNRNTQDDNFGRDRLGVAGMKDDYNNPARGQGLSEVNSVFLKNRSLIETLGKKMVFENDKRKESLLDESRIVNNLTKPKPYDKDILLEDVYEDKPEATILTETETTEAPTLTETAQPKEPKVVQLQPTTPNVSEVIDNVVKSKGVKVKEDTREFHLDESQLKLDLDVPSIEINDYVDGEEMLNEVDSTEEVAYIEPQEPKFLNEENIKEDTEYEMLNETSLNETMDKPASPSEYMLSENQIMLDFEGEVTDITLVNEELEKPEAKIDMLDEDNIKDFDEDDDIDVEVDEDLTEDNK